jgi:hypothetical protein
MTHPYNIGLWLAFWKNHLSRSVHQEEVHAWSPNNIQIHWRAIVSCLCTILLIVIHINNARQHIQKIVAGIRSGITSTIDHQLISSHIVCQ